MLNFIFFILMIIVFGKLAVFALRAAWSISKFLCTIVLFPLFLVGLVIGGLIELAFPILLVVGIISLFGMNK